LFILERLTFKRADEVDTVYFCIFQSAYIAQIHHHFSAILFQYAQITHERGISNIHMLALRPSKPFLYNAFYFLARASQFFDIFCYSFEHTRATTLNSLNLRRCPRQLGIFLPQLAPIKVLALLWLHGAQRRACQSANAYCAMMRYGCV
jgi:hypothetical protein